MFLSDTVVISSRECRLMTLGSSGPLIFLPMTPIENDELPGIREHLLRLCPDASCTILSFPVSCWNDDLSPWPFSRNEPMDSFAGNADFTLDWLLHEAIPYADRCFGSCGKKYISGYSLAGLFALWTVTKTDLFSGAVSCSGSLWFPGWIEYWNSHPAAPGSVVYLSLGGKEEHCTSELISTIGNQTRKQYALLKSSKEIRTCTLEWNSGGHFADSSKRLAKGIAWLLNNS